MSVGSIRRTYTHTHWLQRRSQGHGSRTPPSRKLGNSPTSTQTTQQHTAHESTGGAPCKHPHTHTHTHAAAYFHACPRYSHEAMVPAAGFGFVACRVRGLTTLAGGGDRTDGARGAAHSVISTLSRRFSRDFDLRWRMRGCARDRQRRICVHGGVTHGHTTRARQRRPYRQRNKHKAQHADPAGVGDGERSVCEGRGTGVTAGQGGAGRGTHLAAAPSSECP